jgi:hypothetical protein
MSETRHSSRDAGYTRDLATRGPCSSTESPEAVEDLESDASESIGGLQPETMRIRLVDICW